MEEMEENKVEKAPGNYMVLSIISILLGYFSRGAFYIPLLLGIIALIFSLQVNSNLSKGNIDEAKQSARTAKILGIISVVLSSLFLIFAGLFLGALILSYAWPK